MRRIHLLGQRTQRFGVIEAHLPVHQPLRPFEVVDVCEAVVDAAIADAGGVQLPAEPLAAIDAHVQVERQPRLQPQVHEAKDRMDQVMI